MRLQRHRGGKPIRELLGVREASVPVLVVRADPAGVAPRSLFQRPLMIVADATPDGAPAHIAAALAEAFGGAVAERAASCEQEVAREREATLLVVPAATAGRRGWFGTSAEKVIRSCTLPMLFVPMKPAAESVNLSKEADHDYRAHA